MKNVFTTTGNKILAGIGLSMLLGSSMMAQNTSYGLNSIPIGGSNNCAYSVNSLSNMSTGSYNVGIGMWSLYYTTTGSENIAVGSSVLGYNNGNKNTGVGYAALGANTSGNDNLAIGNRALSNNTTGKENTAIGFNSLYSNVSGNSCVALGYQALYSNTMGINHAIGYQSMYANTTGQQNTALGYQSLYSNSSGHNNAAFGLVALKNNTTGNDNAAFGCTTLNYNTTGWGNTGHGTAVLINNTSGSYNTAVGNNAAAYNTTGNYNTAIGKQAMLANITGSSNSAIGYNALYYNTAGSNNTAMGSGALSGNYTGSNNNTGLGYLSDINASGITNATAIGNGAIVNASNRIWLGNSAVVDIWTSAGGLIALSDKRFKSSVNESEVKGIEFIKLLRPVVYNLETKKFAEFMTRNMSDSARQQHLAGDFSKSMEIRQTGFLAQEVEEAAKKAGYNFSGVHIPKDENDTYGINYAQFVVPLVKAVQEQQAMIETQQQQLDEQKQMIEELKKQSGATGSLPSNEALDGFKLNQNEPNPFNNETIIKFTLPKSIGSAYMAIYDLSGKQLLTFPLQERGASSLTITSEKLTAGIYIYSIIADNKVLDSKRMIVTQKQ